MKSNAYELKHVENENYRHIRVHSTSAKWLVHFWNEFYLSNHRTRPRLRSTTNIYAQHLRMQLHRCLHIFNTSLVDQRCLAQLIANLSINSTSFARQLAQMGRQQFFAGIMRTCAYVNGSGPWHWRLLHSNFGCRMRCTHCECVRLCWQPKQIEGEDNHVMCFRFWPLPFSLYPNWFVYAEPSTNWNWLQNLTLTLSLSCSPLLTAIYLNIISLCLRHPLFVWPHFLWASSHAISELKPMLITKANKNIYSHIKYLSSYFGDIFRNFSQFFGITELLVECLHCTLSDRWSTIAEKSVNMPFFFTFNYILEETIKFFCHFRPYCTAFVYIFISHSHTHASAS